MTPEKAQRLAARAMLERDLQRHLAQACRTLGLRHYHTHDSRRSDPGFPDSIIVGRRVIAVELKRQTEHPSPEQVAWLDAIGDASCPSCGDRPIRAHVWRPSDWLDGTIESELRKVR